MRFLKRFLKALLLPWWILILPRRKGMHPYFGPSTRLYGGPDLKAVKLKKYFGNSLWPSCIYAFSGKPISALFLKAARYKKIPVVLNQNGVYFPAWFPSGYEEQNRRLRRLHDLSDHVLYQSQYCVASSQQWIQPPSRPHEVLYNAVDCRQFKPLEQRLKASPLVLLAATYFNPTKKYVLEHVMTALARLNHEGSPVMLLIAGKMDDARGGSWPEWLEKMIRANKLESACRYLGPYRQSEAPSIYQQAHAFLHLTSMDSCPNAVLEAMACGLPVLYNSSGGTPELVGEAGISLPNQSSYERLDMPSVELIVSAIGRLRGDLVRLSSLARQRAAEHFDSEIWFERHARLFSTLSAPV